MIMWKWSIITCIGNIMIITIASWLAVPSAAQRQRLGSWAVATTTGMAVAAAVTVSVHSVDGDESNDANDYDSDDLASSSDGNNNNNNNVKKLRARLQNHVAAQLRKILSVSDQLQEEEEQQQGNSHCHDDDPGQKGEQCEPPAVDINWSIIGAERVVPNNDDDININQNGNMIELKIDVDSLPSELADFVLNHEDFLLLSDDIEDEDDDEDDDDDDSNISSDNSDNHYAHRTEEVAVQQADETNNVDGHPQDRQTNSNIHDHASIRTSYNGIDENDTPCPLGTYSVKLPTTTTATTALSVEETGEVHDDDYIDLDYIIDEDITYKYDCVPCPEGTTTLHVGSTACKVVTPEDILGMIYDLASGDTWNEHHRKGWKSGIPVCEWAGISCNSNGEINGFSFPAVGFPLFAPGWDRM